MFVWFLLQAMKIFILISLVYLTAAAGSNLFAQDVTFILLRHAEKDVSPAANKDDPQLSAAGRERAGKFFETVKDYKPTQIFSTNYLRTRATVAPLAENLNENYRIQTQNYDFEELDDFAARLLKIKSGTIVVVGHNTTTPMLANLLIKQDKYGTLGDSEYNKIWIIKIKNGKITDQVIEY